MQMATSDCGVLRTMIWYDILNKKTAETTIVLMASLAFVHLMSSSDLQELYNRCPSELLIVIMWMKIILFKLYGRMLEPANFSTISVLVTLGLVDTRLIA